MFAVSFVHRTGPSPLGSLVRYISIERPCLPCLEFPLPMYFTLNFHSIYNCLRQSGLLLLLSVSLLEGKIHEMKDFTFLVAVFLEFQCPVCSRSICEWMSPSERHSALGLRSVGSKSVFSVHSGANHVSVISCNASMLLAFYSYHNLVMRKATLGKAK